MIQSCSCILSHKMNKLSRSGRSPDPLLRQGQTLFRMDSGSWLELWFLDYSYSTDSTSLSLKLVHFSSLSLRALLLKMSDSCPVFNIMLNRDELGIQTWHCICIRQDPVTGSWLCILAVIIGGACCVRSVHAVRCRLLRWSAYRLIHLHLTIKRITIVNIDYVLFKKGATKNGPRGIFQNCVHNARINGPINEFVLTRKSY